MANHEWTCWDCCQEFQRECYDVQYGLPLSGAVYCSECGRSPARLDVVAGAILAEFGKSRGRGAQGSPPEVLLTAAQAAAIAQVDPDTVRAWVRKGLLTPTWVNRELRIKRQDWESFLRSGAAASGLVDTDQLVNNLLMRAKS